MNRSYRWLGLVLYALVLAGCSGSDEAREPREANTISGEELERTAPAATTLAELIDGRIPGVRVVQMGDGSIQVQARGSTTLSGGNALLIVVDGVPTEPNLNGTLPGLNVSEIESIKLLRDLTETSRYGMRAANGVIVVTTKGAARR